MGQHSITVGDVELTITNAEKLLWKGVTKADYLNYLARISPLMLPFLHNKPLTVIRYPDGINGEAFYQRNCPEYAPDFIKTVEHHDNNYMICSDLPSLLWLGTQAAIEFHIPFSTYQTQKPSEIVFDLDPPSNQAFHLAVLAAKQIKDNLDRLHVTGFLKLSGNKGLQIHIPLPIDTFTYEQTKVFTAFMARFLVETNPNLFTIERLKKNRNERLYVDYVQHASGKTIIAPYSPRGNAEGLVAAPIEWNELKDGLTPTDFSMERVLKRKLRPFRDYEKARDHQPFKEIIDWLLSKKTNHL
ncbi:non-homologous end-joining DNA ligase [Pseudalkalibacillus hwajinpoensis]|uniref:non-homologous end-joining DNA ligase n=1 Tax=Guptibacillus hwajinpoensis TaxID=208199 RepID=UPI001CD58EED|nr:non-homologous end-joining DNA ligase [Pseudalkalibacillus hwajinpoensis]MCA0989920.1 non-homologous end-joining DNA ligase [Pseudalkalibacillus hwajinpoensis]